MSIKFPRNYKTISGGCIAITPRRYGLRMKEVPSFQINFSLIYNKKRWLAPRLSYCLNNKKIPCNPKTMKDGLVLHTCDNGWCINPKHLYIGTFSQNMNDRKSISKGRRHLI